MNQISLEFHPLDKLKNRLSSVRTLRKECLVKGKELLELLLKEDDRVCKCAVEEEELLEKIDRYKNSMPEKYNE